MSKIADHFHQAQIYCTCTLRQHFFFSSCDRNLEFYLLLKGDLAASKNSDPGFGFSTELLTVFIARTERRFARSAPVTEDRMRRTVRPFVKEFKTRWSKSSKLPAAEPRPDKPHFLQPFPNADETAQAPSREDEDYLAALKAADAAFGIPPQIAPKSVAPLPHVGRVLPSLIEEPPPYPQSPEPKQKSPQKRKAPSKSSAVAKEKKSASSTKRKVPAPSQPAEPKSLVAMGSQSAMTEPSTGSATRHEARPLRARWVQKTELRPGEKWKRRLTKHAR